MRKNWTIVLLATCVGLLAGNLVVSLRSPAMPVFGQTAGAEGGGYVLATGQSQGGSDAVLWVFETGTKKLACYSMKSRGVEYKGVRNISYDLMPEEYSPKGKSPSVAAVKKEVTKTKKK